MGFEAATSTRDTALSAVLFGFMGFFKIFINFIRILHFLALSTFFHIFPSMKKEKKKSVTSLI